MTNEELIERWGRWLQNTGYDGGVGTGDEAAAPVAGPALAAIPDIRWRRGADLQHRPAGEVRTSQASADARL